MDMIAMQKAVCRKYCVPWTPSPDDLKVGISATAKAGYLQINGLRHAAVGDTTGWYIWGGSGEIPQDDPKYFFPLHVAHLDEWCPEVLPYLGLPPGWRFLLAGSFVDVWEDPSLLNV
jgi:hypothetical protein